MNFSLATSILMYFKPNVLHRIDPGVDLLEPFWPIDVAKLNFDNL